MRFIVMGTIVSERCRITGGTQKIMEASGGDSAKSCRTGVSDIIRRGFPRAAITEKYLTINGVLNKNA